MITYLERELTMRGLLGLFGVTRSFTNSVEMEVAFSRAADHSVVAVFDNQVKPEVAFSLRSFGRDRLGGIDLVVDVLSSNGWLVCI